MKISIIIPCFNASEYINSCFSSLLNQTYANWEAIFVDDGSIDDTWELLRALSVEDERVKIYTKENEGASKARELGISKAHGEYITFLDVDDTLIPDALYNWNQAFDARIDIVASGFNIVKSGKVVKRKNFESRCLTNIDYLRQVMQGRYGWELCAKVYRKELFVNELQHPSIRIGEDAAVFIQLVCRANQIAICHGNYYNYNIHPSSASHVRSKYYAEETLQAAFFIDRMLKDQPFYSCILQELDTMYLLFYSNSTRKAFLGKEHPLVAEIYQKHLHRKSLAVLPLIKRYYILLSFMMANFFCK